MINSFCLQLKEVKERTDNLKKIERFAKRNLRCPIQLEA